MPSKTYQRSSVYKTKPGMLSFIEQLRLFKISQCCTISLCSYCWKRSKRKNSCSLVLSGFCNREFQALDLQQCYIQKVSIQLPWSTEQGKSFLACLASWASSVSKPRLPPKFWSLFLLSSLIISAEALHYRLIPKPGAREVNPVLLLLLPANKRGIKQKFREMEKGLTDLFMVEKNEEKMGMKTECKARNGRDHGERM